MNFITKYIDTETINNKYIIKLTVNHFAKTVQEISDLQDWLKQTDKSLYITIDKEHAKRSLNANAYMWVLVNQIADVLGKSKDETYIQMLTDYGQREPELIRVVADALTILKRATNNHCVVVDIISGDPVYYDVAILIGSSNYNTKDMATLLDGVISEAKELGIDTATPSEIAKMKERWGK
jgi:hypothetical protein